MLRLSNTVPPTILLLRPLILYRVLREPYRWCAKRLIVQRGNWAASARLTFRHQGLRDRYGFLIHPKIAPDLDIDYDEVRNASSITDYEPLSILDFATSNEVWALDLASRLPSLRRKVGITCLDVSDEQAPPRAVVPDNVTIATRATYIDVPQIYMGRFDLVHVRLMQVALFTRGSVEIVARNLATIFKKGGYAVARIWNFNLF